MKVSVLVPLYKTQESHLRAAIDSILNQTFGDFELLLLDDSPAGEDLAGIVHSYQDSRIRYVRNEINLGISASRNKLFDLAQGEYLAIMDHDDISLPQRLEKQVAYLDAPPLKWGSWGVGCGNCPPVRLFLGWRRMQTFAWA